MTFRDFCRHLEDYFSFLFIEFLPMVLSPPIVWFWVVPVALAYWLGQVLK